MLVRGGGECAFALKGMWFWGEGGEEGLLSVLDEDEGEHCCDWGRADAIVVAGLSGGEGWWLRIQGQGW